MEPTRAQLQYPLDAESLGTLKLALPIPLKELARTQAITLKSGDTTFDVRNTDVMSVTASAAVTIATITNGYSGQVLTLLFNDANVTITDTAGGATSTVNLNGAFTSAANVILQLLHDGTSWREIDRSTADVGGPATSTDNAIARWDGTTGTLLQDSGIFITDGGNMLFADGSFLGDTLGNEIIALDTVASPVNYIAITNAATGSSPIISAQGDDATVVMFFQAKTLANYIFQGTSSGPASISLREDTDNGTNNVSLTVAASLASDFTLTLPSATDTLVGKATTDILTNKSIDLTNNTLTATSAQLITAISDETGSGVAVFGTSPTFTTSVLTGSTTFALFNTTATTINFAGATTTLNIGASATCILNFGGSTTASEFRFLEPSGSGTNYTAFKAQAQAANITYTLPNTDGDANQFLQTDGSGGLTWASATLTYKNGVSSRAGNTASGTQTIAHGLGKTPSKIRITAHWALAGSANEGSDSTGVFDGTTTSTVFSDGNTTPGTGGTDATNMIVLKEDADTKKQEATITVDATNITLTWTRTGTTSTDTMYFMWEAEG